MSRIFAGTGISTLDEPAAAIREAKDAALEGLGGRAPALAYLTATVDYDPDLLFEALHAELPGTLIHGLTTSLGVLGAGGVAMGRAGAVGLMLLAGEDGGDFAVGHADLGDDPRMAGRRAGRMLRKGRPEKPSLLLVHASPGSEEQVLQGLDDAVRGVPAFGGTAADHAINGEWRVFTNEGPKVSAVSVAALYGRLTFETAFEAPYRASGETVKVTAGGGRRLEQLGEVPAGTVLRQWIGEGLEPLMGSGGNILVQSSLCPLAVRLESAEGPYYRTLHPAQLHPGGAVDTFADAAMGDTLHRMTGTTEGLLGIIGELTGRALASTGLRKEDVKAAILIYCAGCVGAVGASLDAALRETWRAYPGVPLLGMCTFGEQGPVPGIGNIHANLTVGVLLLADG